MSAAYLDLRVQGLVEILVTQGVSYPAISLDFKTESAPTDMVITLIGYDNGSDLEFTNGNGLSISGNIVLWNLGLVSANKGSYNGSIETESDVFGQALRFKLTLKVS